eukprot:1147562-Pelagomonas_calceolata.AAC.1
MAGTCPMLRDHRVPSACARAAKRRCVYPALVGDTEYGASLRLRVLPPRSGREVPAPNSAATRSCRGAHGLTPAAAAPVPCMAASGATVGALIRLVGRVAARPSILLSSPPTGPIEPLGVYACVAVPPLLKALPLLPLLTLRCTFTLTSVT